MQEEAISAVPPLGNYEARKSLLFATLSSAESCVKGTILDQGDTQKTYLRQMLANPTAKCEKNSSSSVCQFRGKESIFKRPAAPIDKCLQSRHVAAFKVKPHKWTKYTLDDADTSNYTNTAAAFSFLKEIDDRKQITGDVASESRKIVFKSQRFNRQRIMAAQDVEDPADRPSIQRTKLIMPEYVVGQQKPKSEKRKRQGEQAETRNNKSRECRLDHLWQEQEDVE